MPSFIRYIGYIHVIKDHINHVLLLLYTELSILSISSVTAMKTHIVNSEHVYERNGKNIL